MMQRARQILPALVGVHNGSCNNQISAVAITTSGFHLTEGGSRIQRRSRKIGRTRTTDRTEARGRSHLSNKTPEDRVREYGDVVFRCSDNQLVCQFCEKVVDPRRRSSIEYHLKSLTHMRKVVESQSLGQQDEEGRGMLEASMEVSDEVSIADDSAQTASQVAVSSTGVLPASFVLDTDGSGQLLLGTTNTAVIKLEPTERSNSPSADDLDWPVTFGNGQSGPATPLMTDGAISSLCETQLAANVDESGENSSCSGAEGEVVVKGRQEVPGRFSCQCSCHCQHRCFTDRGTEGKVFANELVLKGRLSSPSPSSNQKPFILFELPTKDLSLARLISVCSAALGISSKLVKEVLKLPNTLLIRDKDVRRLFDYQEVELVLHDHVQQLA